MSEINPDRPLAEQREAEIKCNDAVEQAYRSIVQKITANIFEELHCTPNEKWNDSLERFRHGLRRAKEVKAAMLK